MPDIKPWAFYVLFILVFPTGNAISERGFSAMGATSKLLHTRLWDSMGQMSNVTEFAANVRAASKLPNWPLYIHPKNYND
jgi:hypothetical protein